eukprot:957737-Alexandrium_andersonii.AAC.1
MLRGDLEWMFDTFKWHTYNQTQCCHRCCANKKDLNLAYTDLRLHHAGWRRTLISHHHFMQNLDGREHSPWLDCPGMRLERIMGDTMHGIDLGVGQHTAAECL